MGSDTHPVLRQEHAMGAAEDVGTDELCTGEVRRVSVNNAGSFVLSIIFYALDHRLFVFILFDCFSRDLCFFLYDSRLRLLSHSLAFTVPQPNFLSLSRLRFLQ